MAGLFVSGLPVGSGPAYITATAARWAVRPDLSPAAGRLSRSCKPSPRGKARGPLSFSLAYMTPAEPVRPVGRGARADLVAAELVAAELVVRGPWSVVRELMSSARWPWSAGRGPRGSLRGPRSNGRGRRLAGRGSRPVRKLRRL
jgi:hypothetical protein